MAAQRLCGRFVSAAAAGGALLIAAVTWAGPAQADATTFVNDLHKNGIGAVSGGDEALVRMGLAVCQQLAWGARPTQLAGLALQRSVNRQGASGITPRQAEDVVVLAVRDLCPNA